MEYLLFVLVALVAYAINAPLMSVVLRYIPPMSALFLSSAVFLVIVAVLLGVTGSVDPSLLVSVEAGYVYLAGAFLTVGLVAYMYALEAGPVSVVVPIYGMFIVGSSVIGIVALNESVTVARGAGILAGILAIYLTAGEG